MGMEVHTKRVNVTILLLVVTSLLSTPALWAESTRFALVLGNANYGGTAALKNPANDAMDMAAALEKAGWVVALGTDLDRRSLNTTLDTWGELLASTPNATALFYFAGHGMQVDGVNYLLPVKSPFPSEADVRYDALKLDDILAILDVSNVQSSIIILDACRDNPFAKVASRSLGSGTRGLSVVQSAAGSKGSAIMFATGPGEVARDGTGRNGVFTGALLKHLTTNAKLEDVFRQVTAQVRSETSDSQKPWINASLTGDFYFLSEEQRKEIAAEAAAHAARAAQEASAAREAERAALEDQIRQVESVKAQELKSQLELLQREVSIARAREAEAAQVATRLAAEAEKPKGKVRFESSRTGKVTLSDSVLGTVAPGRALIVDQLPTGTHQFRFEAVDGTSETRSADISSLAYVTVAFGTFAEGQSAQLTDTGVVLSPDPLQRGVLHFRARPLSDRAASDLPVLLAALRTEELLDRLEDAQNFTGEALALSVGRNSLPQGAWLLSARADSDTQDTWYQSHILDLSKSDVVVLPVVLYSRPYQRSLLSAQRESLVPRLNAARADRFWAGFRGWTFAIPGSLTLMMAWGTGLMDGGVNDTMTPAEKAETHRRNLKVWGTMGLTFSALSAWNFLWPQQDTILQLELEALDKQIRDLQ